MKTLFLILMCITLLWSEPSKSDLQIIEPDAIVFGQGWNRIYVFVDPMCPNSKNFIDSIQSIPKLQKENTYFVFLYPLEMFKSDKVINAIYAAKNPKQALIDVMALNKPIEGKEAEPAILTKRERIQSIAMKTLMLHRPYLIMYPFGSKYCKVSEGEAACMLQSAK